MDAKDHSKNVRDSAFHGTVLLFSTRKIMSPNLRNYMNVQKTKVKLITINDLKENLEVHTVTMAKSQFLLVVA